MQQARLDTKTPSLDIAAEVAAAIAAGDAVVALESTIITHGMPYPENAATALAVEQVVREAGATPATIAVIDGRCRIGLDAATLDALAAGDALKASKRDLAGMVARGLSAGTTVAATMFLAARAGIAVFATGGIGGVHRGAELSFDVSADLLELAASPVCVVCAGAKSLLDIPKTLEVLETHGVPVVGYQTDYFPAFFAASSGEPVDLRCDTPDAVARLIAAHRALGLPGGLLVGNPIPERHALAGEAAEAAVGQAIAEAAAARVGGKALTPFLLGRIVELTEGRSLTANIALIKHNTRLAAEIAVALAALR